MRTSTCCGELTLRVSEPFIDQQTLRHTHTYSELLLAGDLIGPRRTGFGQSLKGIEFHHEDDECVQTSIFGMANLWKIVQLSHRGQMWLCGHSASTWNLLMDSCTMLPLRKKKSSKIKKWNLCWILSPHPSPKRLWSRNHLLACLPHSQSHDL